MVMLVCFFFLGGEVIIFHLAFPENIFLDQTESEKVSINLRNTLTTLQYKLPIFSRTIHLQWVICYNLTITN